MAVSSQPILLGSRWGVVGKAALERFSGYLSEREPRESPQQRVGTREYERVCVCVCVASPCAFVKGLDPRLGAGRRGSEEDTE